MFEQNTKYTIKVNINNNEDAFRRIYMCLNKNDKTTVNNMLSNTNHPYGNILHNPILNWALDDTLPNLYHRFSKGESSWIFTFNTPNILGPYIFGFICSYNILINTIDNQNSKYSLFGNRILSTAFILPKNTIPDSSNLVERPINNNYNNLDSREIIRIQKKRDEISNLISNSSLNNVPKLESSFYKNIRK